MTVSDIAAAIEKTAPLHFQEEYDNAGMQVGDPSSGVKSVLTCLDVTGAILEEAIEKGCSLVVSHHPLIFRPLKRVCAQTWQQRCVEKALKEGICIYSAHTNLDNSPSGMNRRIADILGLKDTGPLSKREDGAWSGICGTLPEPAGRMEFISLLKEKFAVPCIEYCGEDGEPVSRIAVCSGAGAFLLEEAAGCGADCFISGEFHYHDWFDAGGMLLAGLGHYWSERHAPGLLADIIRNSFPELRILETETNTNPVKYGF